MYGIIYKAINRINKKVYIGQTTQGLDKRKRAHQLQNNKKGGGSYLHHAFNKYGFDTFDWFIIDEAETKEELSYLEKVYIKYYQANNSLNGYNLTSGGDGAGSPNEEVRKRISNSLKGRPAPEGAIERLRKVNTGSKQKPETIIKRRESRIKNGTYYNVKNRNPPFKKVICIDTGKIYESIKDAAKAYSITPTCIIDVCRMKRQIKAGGCRWMYYSEDLKSMIDKDGKIITIEEIDKYRDKTKKGSKENLLSPSESKTEVMA